MASKKKQVVEEAPSVRVILIAAVAANGVIGDKGKLPWHIPEDLKFFKERTSTSPLVMDLRTFESMPKVVWKTRVPHVLTRNSDWIDFTGVGQWAHADELHQLVADAKRSTTTGEVFIVGGAQVYEAALGLTNGKFFKDDLLVDEVILTQLKQSYVGDTVFPMNGLFPFHAEEQLADTEKFSVMRYVRI